MQKKIIFEGQAYTNFVNEFNRKKRFYDTLDLNKVLIADVVPDYIYVFSFKKIVSLPFKIIFFFLKTIIKVFLIKYCLYYKIKGNDNWTIISPSARNSYFNEVVSMSSEVGGSIISWKKEKINISLFKRIKRIFLYLKLLKIIYFTKVNLLENMKLAYSALTAIDIIQSINDLSRPKFVFSLKDFQRYENAIIQTYNYLKIPTFSTQHAVHHCLIGKNNRIGEIVFTNSVAKNIMVWGNFNAEIYKKFNKKCNILESKAILLPKLTNKLIKKKDKLNLLICLPGRRHIKSNFSILKMLKNIEIELNNFNVILRLHPTESDSEIKSIIKKFNFNLSLSIMKGSSDISQNFSFSETIAITGLTGAYYDLLYLGIKTIFIDPNYDLYKKMPTALKGVINSNELHRQLNDLRNMPQDKWVEISKNILLSTLGIEMGQKRENGMLHEINNLVENRVNE